jgi:hypothetical protein
LVEGAIGSDEVDEDDEDMGRFTTDLEFKRASSTACVACC